MVSAVWLQSTPARSKLGDEGEISVSGLPLPSVECRQYSGSHLSDFTSHSSVTCGSQLGAKPQLQFSVIKSENFPSSHQSESQLCGKYCSSLLIVCYTACLTGKSTMSHHRQASHRPPVSIIRSGCEAVRAIVGLPHPSPPLPSPSQREIN